MIFYAFFFFFSSRRRHTRFDCDWSSDVCSSDLIRDIKKVHDIISETHPAKLDEENLEFNHWLEFGYQKSLLLAGRSRSKEQAWAAVNYYLTGFMDEHLTAGRVLSQSSHLYWAGFVMSYKNGRYFATSKANVWPVDLPQIGDEIISCDGVDITAILRSKVAQIGRASCSERV